MEPSDSRRIRIRIDTIGKKTLALASCLFVTAFYLTVAISHFWALHLVAAPSPTNLARAIRLDPWNDRTWDAAGQYHLFVARSASAAIPFFSTAISLNPRQSRYWLDLAAAEYLLGQTDKEKNALARAVSVDPETPKVAWEAASAYVSIHETEAALKAFRSVFDGSPSMQSAALDYCWRLRPDVDYLLNSVIPSNSEATTKFLELLISRNENLSAARVWDHLVESKQIIDRRFVFEYVQHLINIHDGANADKVWRQSASLSDLADYQRSADNLIVNGNFEFAILNAGFDWRYEKSDDVTLALEPDQSQSGGRSLRLTFNSKGMRDSGLSQLIPVQPGMRYHFSATFRSEKLEGAGGLKFVIEDFVTGRSYFLSEVLKSDDVWTPTQGDVQTGPGSVLVVLRIERVPEGEAIKGKLWIDEVRLAPSQEQEAQR